ncbi:MAG TPA: ATP-dependent DNA helicase [Candidatus Eisenbacteria bacterium]
MPFTTTELLSVFEPGGPLSHEIEGFEPRRQQVEMAREVALVLEHGGRLVVEAPTGVGKSLAYLLPSLAWARSAGVPVVVATFTRALQDQLRNADAPIALAVLNSRGTVAVLKGRANYLCRRRLGRAMSAAPPGQQKVFERLMDWADRTSSGDFAECDTLGAEELALIAPRVASDARACAGNLCSPAEGCFFKRARALAAQADVIIVNHALLTIELLGEKGMLPDHGALVVDEAHHLEDAATRQMTISVGGRRMKAAGENVQATGGDGAGAVVKKLLTAWRNDEADPVRAVLADWQKAAGTAGARGEVWFGRLNAGPGPVGGDLRQRYTDAAGLAAMAPGETGELTRSVDETVRLGARLLYELNEAATQSPDPDETRAAAAEVESALSEWKGIQEALDITLHPEGAGSEWVHWREWGDREHWNLVAAPRDVSGPLGQRLRERQERIVLTSATLTVGGHFDHILRRLGLPIDAATLALDTPFDFASSVRVFSVANVPDPRDADYGRHLARTIEELVHATKRKSLALFTSYAMLREVTPQLAALEDAGVRVLAQGKDGSVASILRQFKKPGPALVLGTASFWEGIDLPGELLEILVVTRLPFPVPSDPIVEARGDELKLAGHDPFMSYSVPEAVLKLKQGFGRLIRRQGDKGVVAILDGRFLTARYGGLFRSALPVAPERCTDAHDLAGRARDWMAADPVVAGEAS